MLVSIWRDKHYIAYFTDWWNCCAQGSCSLRSGLSVINVSGYLFLSSWKKTVTPSRDTVEHRTVLNLNWSFGTVVTKSGLFPIWTSFGADLSLSHANRLLVLISTWQLQMLWTSCVPENEEPPLFHYFSPGEYGYLLGNWPWRTLFFKA